MMERGSSSSRTMRCSVLSYRHIEMKGTTRCKLTIISESAVCKKFLGQIWSYPASLQISNSHNVVVRQNHLQNQDKSAARFCHQVAAWVSDMFCDFYLVKKPKIANNSRTAKAREKIRTDLESLEFQKCFDVGLAKFENNQI